MERHFLKCLYCERPMSVNVETQEELQLVLKQKCPLCGELALRYMGLVRKTDIVRQGIKSACDLRCTNAVGPKCDCVCVNKNHGTYRLVVFDKVVGKLEVVEKDLLNNNTEYLARIKRMAAAKNVIKGKVLAVLQYKNKGILEFLKTNPYWKLHGEEYWKYETYRKHLKEIDKIEDYKSIQRKVNAFAHMLPKIGTNLELFAALYDKMEVKV